MTAVEPMGIERLDIEALLEDYAKALSDNDLQRIAAAWHVPSLVVAHGAAVAVSSPEQITRYFELAAKEYNAAGIRTVKLRKAQIGAISDSIAHATVTWALYTADDRQAATEAGFYVISKSGSPPSVGIDFFAHE